MYSKKLAKSLMDAVNEYDGGCNQKEDPFNRVEIFHVFFGSWDVSEFLAEYWPETVIFALENMYYDYGARPFFWLKDENEIEQEIANLMEDYGEDYEDYVIVIRDAAFDGAIFIEE